MCAIMKKATRWQNCITSTKESIALDTQRCFCFLFILSIQRSRSVDLYLDNWKRFEYKKVFVNWENYRFLMANNMVKTLTNLWVNLTFFLFSVFSQFSPFYVNAVLTLYKSSQDLALSLDKKQVTNRHIHRHDTFFKSFLLCMRTFSYIRSLFQFTFH